jgi:DNA-binding MarR family transcriptional regulator
VSYPGTRSDGQGVPCRKSLLLSKIPQNAPTAQDLLSKDADDPFPPQRIRDLLHRKALATSRHRAGIARRLGLNETEAAALAHFARHGRLTPGELGDLLYLTSGGVTALAHRLERAGHIRREPHPRDKRSTLLTATPEILESASELYEPLVSRIDDSSFELSPEERLTIGRFLERIVSISEEEADDVRRAADEAQGESLPGLPAPGLWS